MPVSIFNDVIGPVMRGPSSSHSAAANRIGRLARDLMGGHIERVTVQFDRAGSLATTHTSQGSDMGLFGGLLGWDCRDDRLPTAKRRLREAGVDVLVEIGDFGMTHPNTYRLHLSRGGESHSLTAISTGGGMIEVTDIDGFPTAFDGGAHETLIFSGETDLEGLSALVEGTPDLGMDAREKDGRSWIRVTTRERPDAGWEARMVDRFPGIRVRRLSPVLPVNLRTGLAPPFSTSAEMLSFDRERRLSLAGLAREYEGALTGLSPEAVSAAMRTIVTTLRKAIETGLAGTDYRDRILGCQSVRFRESMTQGRLLDGGVLNRIILYATALMETKSSMGLIVACPTAGACAGLPAACLGVAEELNAGDEAVVEAAVEGMLAAGMIGVLIATKSTFAAEVAGCQAECGSASGMAAAALVTLAGGTADQAVAAASLALQNLMGSVCDPVANRVEVPCLGKNILAASNALASANMALAGYDPVIPLDEVIEAMDHVGKSLPRELRCTGLGGLSVTRTSLRIESELRNRS